MAKIKIKEDNKLLNYEVLIPEYLPILQYSEIYDSEFSNSDDMVELRFLIYKDEFEIIQEKT